MEGNVKLILLNRGEEYVISMPYANCKGILIGKLTMELGGKVNIECVKTGYSAEIEFKLKVTRFIRPHVINLKTKVNLNIKKASIGRNRSKQSDRGQNQVCQRDNRHIERQMGWRNNAQREACQEEAVYAVESDKANNRKPPQTIHCAVGGAKRV